MYNLKINSEFYTKQWRVRQRIDNSRTIADLTHTNTHHHSRTHARTHKHTASPLPFTALLGGTLWIYYTPSEGTVKPKKREGSMPTHLERVGAIDCHVPLEGEIKMLLVRRQSHVRRHLKPIIVIHIHIRNIGACKDQRIRRSRERKWIKDML